jgi:hypothetical protein
MAIVPSFPSIPEKNKMKFKVEVNLGNSHMRTAEHLAMALEKIAKQVRFYGVLSAMDRKILDLNGNTIGSWSLISD